MELRDSLEDETKVRPWPEWSKGVNKHLSEGIKIEKTQLQRSWDGNMFEEHLESHVAGVQWVSGES